MHKQNCPFCVIDTNRSRVVATFKHCHVMFSNPRLMPGHLLVIPNRHVEHPDELTAEERTEIFDTLIAYQMKMLKKAKGTTIRQNFMPFVPESKIKVDHVHYHIIPRHAYDPYYQNVLIHEHDVFKDATEEEYMEWTEVVQ